MHCMESEFTPEQIPESIVIKDYANWVVEDAKADCASLGLSLGLPLLPPSVKELPAIIEKNDPGSPPGQSIGSGGIVGVIIFPLEPRQG